MEIRRSIEWIAFAASSAVILYAGFAAFAYALGPGLDHCANAREAPVANERGVAAEAMARWCAFTGLPNEKRLGLHLSDDLGDSVLVFYEPRNNRDAPVLQWEDADHLSVESRRGDLAHPANQSSWPRYDQLQLQRRRAEPRIEHVRTQPLLTNSARLWASAPPPHDRDRRTDPHLVFFRRLDP
jgi:hypothetical protein